MNVLVSLANMTVGVKMVLIPLNAIVRLDTLACVVRQVNIRGNLG